jgi:DNA-3-methyladenine glycosylase
MCSYLEPVRILDRKFFGRPSTIVARDLIGKILVRKLSDRLSLRGIIVETEAYGGLKDPASHAFRGMTPRNEVMFGEPGFSYVYFTYGFHHCLNVVTGKKGNAQAVLIRALEPLNGTEIMRKNRNLSGASKINFRNLTNGPGKICQALQIDRSLNKTDVTKRDSPLFFEDDLRQNHMKRKITRGPRIGIKVGTEKQWRFYDSSSIYVSHRGAILI